MPVSLVQRRAINPPVKQHPLFIQGFINMYTTSDLSRLHTQAANDHEETANYHRKAAASHDQDHASTARASARSAMDCCHKAQRTSLTACECSEK
jgi:hypothetical protein